MYRMGLQKGMDILLRVNSTVSAFQDAYISCDPQQSFKSSSKRESKEAYSCIKVQAGQILACLMIGGETNVSVPGLQVYNMLVTLMQMHVIYTAVTRLSLPCKNASNTPQRASSTFMLLFTFLFQEGLLPKKSDSEIFTAGIFVISLAVGEVGGTHPYSFSSY